MTSSRPLSLQPVVASQISDDPSVLNLHSPSASSTLFCSGSWLFSGPSPSSCFVYSPWERVLTSGALVIDNALTTFMSVSAAHRSLLTSSPTFPTFVGHLDRDDPWTPQTTRVHLQPHQLHPLCPGLCHCPNWKAGRPSLFPAMSGRPHFICSQACNASGILPSLFFPRYHPRAWFRVSTPFTLPLPLPPDYGLPPHSTT